MVSLLTLILIVCVPYALLRHGFKIDGPLALSISLLMTPLTAYGLMVIAQVLGASGTGVIGMVFVVGSFVIGVPAGAILLVTHYIFWRKRP